MTTRSLFEKDTPSSAARPDEQAPVPPQNLDAEESVLGAMMLAAGAITAVSAVLGSEGGDFYRESHAGIYRAALALYARGEPVDAITLPDELDERGELEDVGGKARVVGLTHAELLAAEIPPRNELVEGLVDVGTVGMIAGLPFARKSWLALELAYKIAAGADTVLGHDVLQDGPVIYVWQDDSTAREVERVQAYSGRHDYPPDLRIRFLLNEGIRLPDDLPVLRALVERDRARLLVIDSLYNVLSPRVGLKDEDVALVIAEIKCEICDRTGCTVCLVDTPRGRARATAASTAPTAPSSRPRPCDGRSTSKPTRRTTRSSTSRRPATTSAASVAPPPTGTRTSSRSGSSTRPRRRRTRPSSPPPSSNGSSTTPGSTRRRPFGRRSRVATRASTRRSSG